MYESLIKIIYILNMLAGTAAMVVFIYYMKIQKERLNQFPKSLKFYLLTAPFLFAVLTAAGSIYFTIHFLIFQDEKTFFFKAIRFTVAITAQQVRASLILIVIERIISTIFLEKYSKFTSGLTMFIVLSIILYLYTFIYTAPSIVWIFITDFQYFYYILLYLNLFLHGCTVIMSHVLHRRNRTMYRLLAYKVSLKRRSQIVENIKVLSFLWPSILLFSTIAPIGIVMTIVFAWFTNQPAPTCLFLITYNVAFALAIFVRIRANLKLQNTIQVESHTTSNNLIVESALGRNLPTTISHDNYFKDLKQLWG